MKIDKKYIDNMILHCKKICNPIEVDNIVNKYIGMELYNKLDLLYDKACELDSERSTARIIKKWEIPIEDDELRDQMEKIENDMLESIQNENR
jgi:hypothetical protein